MIKKKEYQINIKGDKNEKDIDMYVDLHFSR